MSETYSAGPDGRMAALLETRSRELRRRRRPQLRTMAARVAFAIAAVWTIAFGIGVVLH